MEDGDAAIGKDAVLELMDAVDTFIPQPERDLDKPFLMAVEDVFSIAGEWPGAAHSSGVVLRSGVLRAWHGMYRKSGDWCDQHGR